MNYVNTLITVAPDCPAVEAEAPPHSGSKASVGEIQFELISKKPYHYTQEDVLWLTHVRHKGLSGAEASGAARRSFLSRPQACLRSSPLAKRYGWGLHFDRQGKVALIAVESRKYASLSERKPSQLQLLAAFRTSRKQPR